MHTHIYGERNVLVCSRYVMLFLFMSVYILTLPLLPALILVWPQRVTDNLK